MGKACAEQLVRQGAEVHGADLKAAPFEMASFNFVDLRDWNSIDAATLAVGGEIDALFNCAGLPQSFPARDVMQVNFLGIRHWTNRWLPKLKSGSGVVTISSLAGLKYKTKLELMHQLNAITDEQEFLTWMDQNPELLGDGYTLSKELVLAWTQIEAVRLAPQGIRVNATLPSPTDTPMMPAFEEQVGAAVLDAFCVPTGRRSTAEEQAAAVLFLNSGAAGFINGLCMPVDGGFDAGITIGAYTMRGLIQNATQRAT
jgi:NAD(P)-dependent dehydrogenase (short-subunit alcohol dehydrogenase family)